MAPLSMPSGNLLADRRFEYGSALLEEGDAAAAADLFRQALDLASGWAPAWIALGRAELADGHVEAAAIAFAEALRLDPEDRLGAGLHLARLRGTAPTLSPGYVQALFDAYAPQFDAHLQGALGYRGPALLADAIRRTAASDGRAFRFSTGLDLGCGTGLMAGALAGAVDHLTGVDLSPAMLAEARKTGLYERLDEADFQTALDEAAPRSLDLVVAADVLVYVGDLQPVFAAAAKALAGGGFFAFTVQTQDGIDFALGEDLRFVHSAAYLTRLAGEVGLRVARLDPASTRKDAGHDVPGLVAVLVKD